MYVKACIAANPKREVLNQGVLVAEAGQEFDVGDLAQHGIA